MTNTGPASAWRFLKRNPGYGADWRAAGRPPPEAGLPFPVWVQTQSDRAAAPWGLLAWENPHVGDEPASPFWADVPMMDGEIDPPDAPLHEASLPALLRETGGRLSGLRLLDGALIVKIERGGGTAQLRIAGAHRFLEDSGVTLRLPVGPKVPLRIARAGDLWSVVAGVGPTKAGAS